MNNTLRSGLLHADHSESVAEAIDNLGRNLLTQNHAENKLLVRLFFRAIDARDSAALYQYVSVDYLDHNPQFPNLPSGIEGLRRGFEIALGAWSDVHHEVLDQIAEGDKVVSRISTYGIHVGEFLGVPATNKRITMSGIAIHRIANGRLAEHWANIDQVGVLVQLGIFPCPPPA